MRIVQITPGAGENYYCENCIRDAALVRAMRGRGHDVFMVPIYLPIPGEMALAAQETPIFFGGINVYLQQKWKLFRKTPRWLDKIFDRPGLLRWAGRKGEMTSAKDLGETTISTLEGMTGRQAKEFRRLIEWLGQDENRPDVVCLSNVMLASLAGAIKKELNVPVFCILQDEEGFLDGLAGVYRDKAWEVLRELAGDIDGYISVSRYYADVMQERLGIGDDRMHVVHVGIELENFTGVQAKSEVPTIGFISQINYSKGLDVLADAFIRLKGNEKFKNLRLRVAGGRLSSDEPFIAEVCEKLEAAGVRGDVEFWEGFDTKSKIEFLRGLSVMCVPEREAIAYSLYVLEALAVGVPFVEPKSGVFEEIVEATGGGVLYKANDLDSLVNALDGMLSDTEHARQLGERGREAVISRFNIDRTVEAYLRIFDEC
jgi:glycosyltransferase involved in cell wall biosynthesis